MVSLYTRAYRALSKRHYAAGPMRASRRNAPLLAIRQAVAEALESRMLLSVSAEEYATIRGTYADFALPADMAGVNIIEITSDQLSVANLKSAISSAEVTTLPDLVVVRTTDTQNTITSSHSTNVLTLNIPATQGAISIVGFGTRPLTLDAAQNGRLISVGAYGSTTTVNLGGLALTNGAASGNGGGITQSYGTLRLTNVTMSGNMATSSGGGLSQSYGTSILTNVMITGNTALSDGGGLYQKGGISTLNNVTISGNMALSYGGGLAGNSTLNNTIVARNTAVTAPDLFTPKGTLAGSNNLIGDGTGQTSLVNGISGNVVGTAISPIDPMLAEDTRFGMSLSPLPGSPAIDAGDDSWIPAGISTDIYGASRIQGARVNIGAVETVLPGMAGVTYVVTSLGNSVAADGVLTLREALAAANTNQAVGDALAGSYSSADRIEFAAGLSGSILTNGQPYQITSSVDLAGPGASSLTLNAGGSGGVLSVVGVYDVSVSGLTLTGGNSLRGGGVYSFGANLTLHNLVISGNTGSPNGGGLYQYGGRTILTNVTISGNTSSYGGGVYQNGGNSTLTNVTISGNTGNYGGGVSQSGGILTLMDVTFSGNLASSYGGGLHQSNGISTLTNVTISRNTATSGGGWYQDAGTSTLANVTISGNTGTSYGGGMYQSGGTATLANVTISRNAATASGGGLYQSNGTLTLKNTIVARNTATAGPDVYRSGGTLSGSNNLIGDGEGQTELVSGVSGNLVGTTVSPIDPMLAEDSRFGIDLSPLPGSPAIDSGDDSLIPAGVNTDIYGTARIQGVRVNIGAVETILPAMAVTYVVTSLADSVAADGVLTLREALAAANTNQAVGDAPAGSYSPADRIEFAAGLTGTILTNGQVYQITSSVDLVGPGASELTLDAGGSGGVLSIVGVYDVSVSGLTLTGGNATRGGAINSSRANLSLHDLLISGNTASSYGYGGGVYQDYGNSTMDNVTISGNGAWYGGGVYQNYGAATLTSVTISGNTAANGGGWYMVYGASALTNVTISGNTASVGYGGGLYQAAGTSALTNVTISGNSAATNGGGVSQSGTSTLTNVTISGNTASNGYGGGLATGATSTLTNVTISGNMASTFGGGLHQDAGASTLRNVTISGNTASSGGGVFQRGGTSTLTNVTINSNTASTGGGGGLFQATSDSTSTLTNVTISGNVAASVGGGVAQYVGTLTLNNAIVARNTATAGPDLSSTGTLSGANNLIGDGTGETALVNGVSGNLVGTVESPIDPMLAEETPLGTLSPLPGSPAIDAGDDSLIPAGVSTDIYGAARIQGARVNIGAVETVLPGMAGAVYVVTSLGDTVATDGVLTLREALAAANTNQAVGDAAAGSYSSADRIEFAAALTGTILTHGQAFEILGSVDLVGPGASQLTLDGDGSSGVLSILGVYDVSVSGLTLTGGNAAKGGGVSSSGANLRLNDLVISGNAASSSGGGLYQFYGISTLTNVTIGGNTASSYGGGLYQMWGTSVLANVTVSGNLASEGGGLYLNSTSMLTDVIVSGNTASNYGGGMRQAAGTSTLTNVTISENTASRDGGGLYQTSGTSTLTNVTISGNTASNYGYGGGIYRSGGASTLANVTISGNTAYLGGGLYSGNNGTLTLKNTVVARNAANISPDLATGTLSGSNNLIGVYTGQSLVNGVNGNLVGTPQSPINPMLAEDTRFGVGLSPLPGSPAIDAGDDSLVPAGITTDIYGAARIQGARVNIGAVETVLPGMAAVTYVVTSLADNVAADGVLTLREALAAANTNQAVGDAPAGSYSSADRIEFASGLTGAVLTNGQPYQIVSSVDLVGPGASELALDAAGSSGVLRIVGVYDVSVSGLTLTGGNAGTGGGVYSLGANLVLDHVVISGNTASWGGGLYLAYGALALTNTTISGNYGGGLYRNSGTSTLTNLTISGNTTSGSGGGLSQVAGTSTLTNVIISGNTASEGGGGMYQSSGTSTLTNVTISGNTASYGGGLYQYSGILTLKNTIVALNSARDVSRYNGTFSGANNLIGDGTALVNGVSGNLVGTTASPIDPLFISMVGTDWTQWNLRLRWDSPAVNSGDNAWIPPGITTDIAGGPRILDGTVDMGAYEFNAGDANHDGKVDSLDLSLLGANWQTPSADGDLNGDGMVDGLDLSLLGANWQGTLVEALNVAVVESAEPMLMTEVPAAAQAIEPTMPATIVDTEVHQTETQASPVVPPMSTYDPAAAGSIIGSAADDTLYGGQSDDFVLEEPQSSAPAVEASLVDLQEEPAMADEGSDVISGGNQLADDDVSFADYAIYADPGIDRVSWDERDSIFEKRLDLLV